MANKKESKTPGDCPYCGRSFTSMWWLQAHIEHSHEQLKEGAKKDKVRRRRRR